jgi:hypothetical protein
MDGAQSPAAELGVPHVALGNTLKNESGQAVVEYILLLMTVVGMWAAIMGWASRTKFAERLMKPITGSYAAAYQLGDINAVGFEEGTPKRHARFFGCEECFRIFINPGNRK